MRLQGRHMHKLNEFGIFGDINTSLLRAITEEQEAQLRETMGVRGPTSIEASVIKESKDGLRRAISMGNTCVEDRCACDLAFCDRVHQQGRSLRDCIHDDLPGPPRTRAQLTAGVAANAEHDHLLTKLLHSLSNTVQHGQRFGDSCLASNYSMKQSTFSTLRRTALTAHC